MKKIIIILMIALISGNGNAFDDLEATPVSFLSPEQNTTFLDANVPVVQYIEEKEEIQGLDEYDQNVSDNVSPAQIGKAEATIKHILGELLIRYISLREKASIYFKEIKDVLMQWYKNII